MYKVISQFKDKLNPQHFYNVGDNFISTDEYRITDLLSRQLIEEVEKEVKIKDEDTRVKAKKSKVVKAGD